MIQLTDRTYTSQQQCEKRELLRAYNEKFGKDLGIILPFIEGDNKTKFGKNKLFKVAPAQYSLIIRCFSVVETYF